jgi:glycosyltransferase involved in cell wall biosynthesis
LSFALDATYSTGSQLTGVGVYCREILHGLAAAHPEHRFRWFYRPHRILRSLEESLPRNCTRRLLLDSLPVRVKLFHGLNQRFPKWRAQRRVATFHDLFVMTGEYSTPEFRQRFIQQARDAAAAADRIIAVSQFTANQTHELLGVEWGRLRVVHHGVRSPKAVPPGVGEREPIVLHVGAIQTRKNIARLISAFRALPEPWKLILAGSAGYEATQALADAGNRVQVTGYVDEEQLTSLYRRASIFAFPSLDEGFGIPVLEAMANGVPVIASNTSALPEVCGDAAILVDPRNTEEIAAELRRLAADQSARQELTRRGFQRVSQFTWQNAIGKTWEVYEELA